MLMLEIDLQQELENIDRTAPENDWVCQWLNGPQKGKESPVIHTQMRNSNLESDIVLQWQEGSRNLVAIFIEIGQDVI